MIDVIFINPHPDGRGLNEATLIQPLGLISIAAVLEKEGFSCAIIDANVLNLNDEEILKRIPQGVRLIGIHVNSFTYDSAKRLTARIKKCLKEAVVVLGGPLATSSPDMILEEIQCDGVIKGEGEYSVLKMMQNISQGVAAFDERVSGANYFNKDKSVIMRNPVSRIEDLDRLPFPAHHLLPALNVYKRRNRKTPAAPIITSRGCSYSCIFCSKDIFERKVTFRSADNVLREIDYLVNHYNIRQIDILDDNFSFHRQRTEDILNGIIDRGYNLAINVQSGIRTELLDDKLLDIMKKAGVYKLGFGIESADESVLKLCRKQIDLDRVKKVVQSAVIKGFIVYGFFIVGLPGETDEGFERTLEFARSLNLDVANFCMATPFPGTELYKMIEKKGRFLVDTSRNIGSGFYDAMVFYEYGDDNQKAVLKRYKRAYREFYSFKKKVKLLLSIRSFEELRWLCDIAIMLFKGMAKNLKQEKNF